jgi:hypothetical protein
VILHVVLYQPKASASQAELSELIASLEQVSREIPSVRQVRVGKSLDLGIDYLRQANGQEYGYCAVFEFNDKNGLLAYLGHESHAKLAELFWKTCEQPMIMDILAADPKAEDIRAILVE